jgi:DNA invertase Pin-like site-specific DNA recombinase
MSNVPRQQLRAAVYTRVSSQDQVHNTSLEDQRLRCEAEIGRRGWTLHGVYPEEGFTGTRDRRPVLDQLRADCQAGLIDVIVATKVDRLARRTWVMSQLVEELDALGVGVVVLEADIDTTTSMGKALREVMAVMAQLDRDQTVEKLARGQHAAAAQGAWPCSTTPFGYRHAVPGADARLVIDEDQARVIRCAFQLLVREGRTTGEVCSHLNALGWLTPTGVRWTHQNLRRKLSATGLMGEFVWANPERKGSGVTTGRYGEPKTVRAEPILTTEEFAALQRSLARKARGGRSTPRTYPLSGRLLCPCGQPYGGAYRADRGLRQYRCRDGHWRPDNSPPACTAPRLSADWVEQQVWAQVCDLLGTPERLLDCVGDYLGLRSRQVTVEREELTVLDMRAARLERALHRAIKEQLLADHPELLESAVAELEVELAEVRQLQETARAWRAESQTESRRVKDIWKLAEVAAQRLPTASVQQQAEVLALLDMRVTVLDNIPQRPRRGGKGGGQGEWRPRLNIEGSVPSARLLATVAGGDPASHEPSRSTCSSR